MSLSTLPALTGAITPTRFQLPQLTSISTTTAQALVLDGASTNQIKLTSSIIEFNVGTVAAKVKLLSPSAAFEKGLWLWIKCKGTTGSLTVQDYAGTTDVLKLGAGESAMFLVINGAWHTFRAGVPVTEGASSVSASGTVTMTLSSNRFQKIDGGASDRNVLLPAVFSGGAYYIANAGASNNLAIKDSTGTTTYATLLPGEAAWIVATASAWVAYQDRPVPVKGGTASTISATLTMSRASTKFQSIDGGAANRDVILPALYLGAEYRIQNAGGTNNLVVKSAAGPTVTTLTPGQVSWFAANSDATAWVNVL